MVSLTTPEPGAGRGGGRGRGAYSSAVGEPGAGVPIPSRGGGGRGAPAPATTPPAAAPAPAPPPAPPPSRRPRFRQVNGGRHHSRRMRRHKARGPGCSGPPASSMRSAPTACSGRSELVSGKDVRRPAPFVPAGARVSDLIAVNDRVYAATSNGCGGAADGIWAIDVASDKKPVVSWKTNGGSPLGSVAFATNGTAIVAIGPGTVTAGGIRERDRRARSEDARREGLVQAARRRVRGAARAVSGGWQGHRRRHDQGWAHPAARRRLSRRHESRHAAVRVGVAHWRSRNIRGAGTGDVAGASTGPRRSRRRACGLTRADCARWRPLAAHSGRGSAAGWPGSSRERRRVERGNPRRQAHAPGGQVLGHSRPGYRRTSQRR